MHVLLVEHGKVLKNDLGSRPSQTSCVRIQFFTQHLKKEKLSGPLKAIRDISKMEKTGKSIDEINVEVAKAAKSPTKSKAVKAVKAEKKRGKAQVQMQVKEEQKDEQGTKKRKLKSWNAYEQPYGESASADKGVGAVEVKVKREKPSPSESKKGQVKVKQEPRVKEER